MKNINVILRPCPWCKRTPDIYLSYDDNRNSNGTWCWYIYCDSDDCNIKPKSRYIAIRNTTKFNREKMINKIIELSEFWNKHNPCIPSGMKSIDIEFLLNEGKKQHESRSSRDS